MTNLFYSNILLCCRSNVGSLTCEEGAFQRALESVAAYNRRDDSDSDSTTDTPEYHEWTMAGAAMDDAMATKALQILGPEGTATHITSTALTTTQECANNDECCGNKTSQQVTMYHSAAGQYFAEKRTYKGLVFDIEKDQDTEIQLGVFGTASGYVQMVQSEPSDSLVDSLSREQDKVDTQHKSPVVASHEEVATIDLSA